MVPRRLFKKLGEKYIDLDLIFDMDWKDLLRI